MLVSEERIVRLEIRVTNLEKAQIRMETKLDFIIDQVKKIDKLSEDIAEIKGGEKVKQKVADLVRTIFQVALGAGGIKGIEWIAHYLQTHPL